MFEKSVGGTAHRKLFLDLISCSFERLINVNQLGVTTGLTSPSLPYFAVKPFILLRDVEVPEGIPLAVEVGGS